MYACVYYIEFYTFMYVSTETRSNVRRRPPPLLSALPPRSYQTLLVSRDRGGERADLRRHRAPSYTKKEKEKKKNEKNPLMDWLI